MNIGTRDLVADIERSWEFGEADVDFRIDRVVVDFLVTVVAVFVNLDDGDVVWIFINVEACVALGVICETRLLVALSEVGI